VVEGPCEPELEIQGNVIYREEVDWCKQIDDVIGRCKKQSKTPQVQIKTGVEFGYTCYVL